MAGASNAYHEGESPFVGGMKEAARTATLDKIFKMMHPLKQYFKAPATGTIFGFEEMEAAPEGQKAKAFAKGFGTGVGYSMSSPGGRLGLNEVKEATRVMYEDLKRANRDLGEAGQWTNAKRYARDKTKYQTEEEKKALRDYARQVEEGKEAPLRVKDRRQTQRLEWSLTLLRN